MRELLFPEGVSLYANDSRETLAINLAKQIAVWLNKALAEKQRALLAVAGGRTPVSCFEVLSKTEIDWSRVDVILTDERWVDDFHIDSHAALLKRYLLKNMASTANFIPMKTAHADPFEGWSALEDKLAKLSWPIDILVLGMGREGHTASLFPDAEGLQNAMTTTNKCVPIVPPEAPHQRMTLSYSALKSAKNTVLYMTGSTKTSAMSRVLDEPENVAGMPVRGFLDSKLTVYWSA